MKTQKLLTIASTILCVFAITACQSKPELRQVDKSAKEKPVNTPEMADQLKQQYEK